MDITDPLTVLGRLFFFSLAIVAGAIILCTRLRDRRKNAPWQIGFKARPPEKPGEL